MGILPESTDSLKTSYFSRESTFRVASVIFGGGGYYYALKNASKPEPHTPPSVQLRLYPAQISRNGSSALDGGQWSRPGPSGLPTGLSPRPECSAEFWLASQHRSTRLFAAEPSA